MPLYLIRHSKSLSNKNPEVLKKTPDFNVEICPQEALDCENHFKKVFVSDPLSAIPPQESFFIVTSPYRRAVQTTEILRKVLVPAGVPVPFITTNLLVCERNMGFLHKNLNIQYAQEFPLENCSYNKSQEDQTQFFETPAGGESPQQVLTRLALFYSSPFVKQCLESPHYHLAVVAHSAVLNLTRILMEKRSPLELESLGTPPNAAIHKYVQKYDTAYFKQGIVHPDWTIMPIKAEIYNP